MWSARQREEHVVERRLAHLDVVHQHPRRVERPHDRGRQPGRRVDAGTEPPAVLAHVDLPGHQRRHGPDRRRRAASASVTSRRALRLASFSSSGVPSAMTRPWSTTTMRLASCVGLLEVLRRQQHGDALAEQLPDGLPHPLAADVGSSPVVGSSRNSTGGRVISDAGQVQPAAHAARVALQHPVGGVGQLELRQQLGRPGPGRGPAHVATARRPGPGSGARSAAGPSVASWAATPMWRRTSPGCFTTSIPATVRRPGVGQRPAWSGSARRSSCRHRSGRAARGSCPAGTAKDDPGQGLGLAVALRQALGLDHQLSSYPWTSLPVGQ